MAAEAISMESLHKRILKQLQSFLVNCESFIREEVHQSDYSEFFKQKENLEMLKSSMEKIFKTRDKYSRKKEQNPSNRTYIWTYLNVNNSACPKSCDVKSLCKEILVVIEESSEKQSLKQKGSYILKIILSFIKLHHKLLPSKFAEISNLLRSYCVSLCETYTLKPGESNEFSEEIEKYEEICFQNNQDVEEIEQSLMETSSKIYEMFEDWHKNENERNRRKSLSERTNEVDRNDSDGIDDTIYLFESIYQNCFQTIKYIYKIANEQMKKVVEEWVQGNFDLNKSEYILHEEDFIA